MTNLQPYKIAASELSSSSKQNNMIQAIEDQFNIVSAKGDLIVATADNTLARHAVGANDDLLVADSTQTNGIKWAKIGNAHILSTAAVAVSKLAAGSNEQVLKTVSGVPTWVAGVTLGTALPGSPVDGQEFILTDSLTAPTYAWRLRYIAAKSTNKWQFIGGSELRAGIATNETTTSTTYAALTTAGPSITLPVAGDYLISIGFEGAQNTAGGQAIMSYDIGATAAAEAERALMHSGTVNALATVHRAMARLGLGAVTLTAKYRAGASGGTASFGTRSITALPIAIGG